jgi:hypothetical protein
VVRRRICSVHRDDERICLLAAADDPQVRPGGLAAALGHRQAGGPPHPVLGDLQSPGQRAGEAVTDAHGQLTAGKAADGLGRDVAPRAPRHLRRAHA